MGFYLSTHQKVQKIPGINKECFLLNVCSVLAQHLICCRQQMAGERTSSPITCTLISKVCGCGIGAKLVQKEGNPTCGSAQGCLMREPQIFSRTKSVINH